MATGLLPIGVIALLATSPEESDFRSPFDDSVAVMVERDEYEVWIAISEHSLAAGDPFQIPVTLSFDGGYPEWRESRLMVENEALVWEGIEPAADDSVVRSDRLRATLTAPCASGQGHCLFPLRLELPDRRDATFRMVLSAEAPEVDVRQAPHRSIGLGRILFAIDRWPVFDRGNTRLLLDHNQPAAQFTLAMRSSDVEPQGKSFPPDTPPSANVEIDVEGMCTAPFELWATVDGETTTTTRSPGVGGHCSANLDLHLRDMDCSPDRCDPTVTVGVRLTEPGWAHLRYHPWLGGSFKVELQDVRTSAPVPWEE